MPEEYIYLKGEAAEGMFFLEHGQAVRIIKRGDVESRRISIL